MNSLRMLTECLSKLIVRMAIVGIEVKSGATFASDWPQAVHKWAALADTATLPPRIIFGGDGRYERQGCQVSGWREFALNPFSP